jgi:chitinase
VVATDVAGNASTLNDSVTIDNAAPAPTNISASGGTAGRPEIGDVLTLTTNDTLDSFSLLANWTGAATTVQVRFVNNAGADRLQIWNSAGTTQLPFGTIALGRTDFTAGTTLSFNGSTMTQSNGVITVTLGAPFTGTQVTVGGTGTMVWTPSATATDRAGNAMTTAAFNEPAPTDRDF